MGDTTSRALALLDLLQGHRHWTGAELAQRLGTTERTVRRDVGRLRDLGYRIDAVPGAHGGYRLEAGRSLPPLLLTDDEGVAIAVGLRIAAAERIVDAADVGLSALAKLEQVLPSGLRRRVTAIAESLHPRPGDSGAAASADVLADLALACRDHERVRFHYVSVDGTETRRRVEPRVLAPADRRWYLLAWDLDREDWRTFRVDRIGDVVRTGARFKPQQLTDAEVDEFITVASAWSGSAAGAAADIEISLGEFRSQMGQWSQGSSEIAPGRVRWPVGGDNPRDTMYGLAWIPEGAEYRVDMDEPARAQLHEILTRMLRAIDAPRGEATGGKDSGERDVAHNMTEGTAA